MEPVSQRDISKRLGKKLEAVWQWRQRDLGFPEPLSGPIPDLPWLSFEELSDPRFDWAEVERWAVQTGRLKSDDKGEQA